MNETLGDFRLIREVGRGGMGIVYLAEQVSLGRQVALKVLPPHLTRSERQVKRFHREASAAAKLHHPNIVAVHAVGEVDGHHYYAMDYIDGKSLGDVIDDTRGSASGSQDTLDQWEGRRFNMPPPLEASKSGALPAVGKSEIAVAAGIGFRVAEALAYAHDNGVIHRDIKPSNIVIDGDGLPLVTDFGLAKEIGDDKSLSVEGSVMGTPRYMSPEQAAGSVGAADHRTDIYSLGATLYELLTLEAPFEGKNYQEILRKIVVKEARPPRRSNPDIPIDLETIVMKAMEKDPERRYQSAREMADDLQRFLNLQPIRARPASTASRCVKYLRRHREIMMAGSVVAVVLIGTAGWLAFQAWRDSGKFESLLDDAEVAFAAERHDDAVSLLDQALGLRPGDPLAEEKRRRFADLREERRGEAGRAEALEERLQRAREHEKEGVANLVQWTSLGARLEENRQKLGTLLESVESYTGPDDKKEVWALEDEIREQAAEREDVFNRVLNSFHAALALADSPELREKLAEAYFLRREELLASLRPDESELERLAKQVTVHDGEDGPFARRLDRGGALSLATDPPGADVYIFRYEQRERRLWPMAFDIQEREVEPPPERHGGDDPTASGGVYVAPPAYEKLSELRLNHLGRTPIESVDLPRGSYLLRIVKDGYEPIRYPVLIRADQESGPRNGIKMYTPEQYPPGEWVYVPEGASLVGGGITSDGLSPHPVYVEPFFISRFEVTWEEYTAFLNDPWVFDEILELFRDQKAYQDGSARAYLLPRLKPQELEWKWHTKDGDQVRVSAQQRLRHPIYQVSWFDAQRYAEWLNELAATADEPWEYSLPTTAEWERAARGADGRSYPWGDGFDWTFCEGGESFANARGFPSEIGGFPADESPFGVRSMAGGVIELCANLTGPDDALRSYRGGNWGETNEARFHLAIDEETDPLTVDGKLGFRLVCRPLDY